MGAHAVGVIIADRYRIDEIIGHGGAATTYGATHLPSEAAVVLKQLRIWHERDWKSLDLFQRECQVLGELTHPSVPRYIDHFEIEEADGRQFYVVQERAPGWPLSEWLRHTPRFSEEQVVRVADQLLDILTYLHGRPKPVIHRDIKPQNIIMSEQGRLYLVDFGAVRSQTQVERAGTTVVGTFGYMAPEQLRGVAVPATDLYSLGVTLLQLLTGLRPDEMDGAATVRVPKGLPASARIRSWLEKLLAPDLKDRFQTAVIARRELHQRKRLSKVQPRRVIAGAFVLGALVLPAAGWIALQFPELPGTAHRKQEPFVAPPSSGVLHRDRTLTGHWNAVFSAAFSPDGQYLYSASHDGTVRRWRIPAWETDRSYLGHTVRVGKVRPTPDGEGLVTAGRDGSIRIWDTDTRLSLRVIDAHRDQVSGLAVSGDGARVYSTSLDRRVAAWSLADGKLIWERDVGVPLYSAALSPDGKHLATGARDGGIRFFSAADGAPVFSLTEHSRTVGDLAFSSDGATLVSAGDDRLIGVWHVSARRRIRWLRGHNDEVWCVAVSPNGKLIVSGGKDSALRLWDMYTGEIVDSAVEKSPGILTLGFAPSGAGFAAGVANGAIQIFSFQEQLWEPPEVKTPTPRGAFAPEPGSSPVAALVQEANHVMDESGEPTYSGQRIRRLLQDAQRADATYAPPSIAPSRFAQDEGNPFGRKYTPGSPPESARLLDRAAELDPKSGAVWIARGHLALIEKRIAVAKLHAKRASELSAEPHRLIRLEANIAERERRWMDVHALARRLLQSDPNHRDRVLAYQDLADVFRARGATAACERMYRSVINLQPNSGWARGNFAWRLTHWGRFDEAISVALEARKVHDYPRLRIVLAEAHAGKARALALQGNVSEARESLKAAEAEAGEVAAVHLARGALREKAGDRDGARKAYEHALELEPDLKEAKKALRLLGD